MSAAVLSVPPLRDGERLSREEFERRYDAMPNVRADLLNGVVYMASPVTSSHAIPGGELGGWMYLYKSATPGVETGRDCSLRLIGSMPQPDAYLRIKENYGGQSRVDEDEYIAGAPELLGEVAKSSLSYDLTVKMPIYRREGVLEFIIWRVEDAAIDWYVLRNGNYVELPVGPDGVIRSETFPGLWLDVDAMIREDANSVVRVLQLGIATPEHTEFVAKLAAQRSTPK